VKKDIMTEPKYVALLKRYKKIIWLFSATIIFFGCIMIYVNFRPAFLKIKPVPEQLADLKTEMNNGFNKIFNWQNKQDSINNVDRINHQHLPTVFPIASNELSKVSSKFGIRVNPITNDTVWHRGVDVTSKKGTPVYASASGTVIKAQRSGGYGNLIEIDSGNGVKTLFGHLNTMLVVKNEYVEQGQIIGTVGNTGMSTGNHLHYEILNNDKNLNPIIFY
jgi:murein DD-endopeptidase MepM/ murein hydrolase activator NlpD